MDERREEILRELESYLNDIDYKNEELEDLITELNNRGVIDVDWVQIY